jgi:hypothetical protein
MVYMRYKLNGQHYERWEPLNNAKKVKDEIVRQGGIIYWTERC